MKALCSFALKAALFCGCFAQVLISCEEQNPDGPARITPVAFSEKYFDKLSKPLSNSFVYSKAVSLTRNSIMQSMDIAKDGSIYYVQIAGTDSHQLNVLKGTANETGLGNPMILEFFGHGTNMALEETGGETYVWMGSHGNKGSDGEYGGSQTISRVKYEPGRSVQLGGDDVFHLNGARNIHPAINVEKGLLGVQYSKGSSTSTSRYFAIYKLSEAMKLAPTDVTLDALTYGGGKASVAETTVILTVKARELSQLKPIYRIAVPEGYAVGELSFQGYDMDDQFIYYYEGIGNDNKVGTPSKAYVSVLDRNGRLSARSEVASIVDAAKLNELGISDRGYMEAEGIKIKNGTLYLGFASRLMDGNTDRRCANIFKYTNE